MTKKKELTLLSLEHIGIVVRDLKKAIEYYSTVFGIGPFTSMDAIPIPKKLRVKGKSFDMKLNVAVAQMGPVQIELLEPAGDGPHKWFLDSKGEGLHHLGFIVDNYDAWIDYAKQQGIEILLNADLDLPGTGHMRVAYLESDKPGSVLVEVIEVTPFK